MDASGDFLVTWSSNGQDGSGNGVYAQRFAADGTRLGNEFRVNAFTSGAQGTPSVAIDADGDFAIVWSSFVQDGSGYGVYAQRYTSSGTAIGSAFKVNTTTTGDQLNAQIAMDDTGDFVVGWLGAGSSGPGFFAQRYAADGTALGGEFRVDSSGFDAETGMVPALGMNADGSFMAFWTSSTATNGYEVAGREFLANGNAAGTPTFINSFRPGDQQSPSVSVDASGNFVVAWSSYAQDGDQGGVYAQRFSLSGAVNQFLIPENSPAGTVVGTLNPGTGLASPLTYQITAGNTGNAFSINTSTGEISVQTQSALDFETRPTFTLTVLVTDANAQSRSISATVQLSNVSETGTNAPPNLALTNTVTSLPESTNTSSAVRVANIQISDDGLGTNTLTLSGTDAGLFQIIGMQLYLRAGTTLSNASNPVLDVTVNVNDPSVGSSPDSSASLAVNVTTGAANTAPTMTLQNTITSLPQSTDTTNRIKVADIVISDDGQGVNELTLTGTDAADFEIVGTGLYLQAGTILDAGTRPDLFVTVNIDDVSVGSSPDASVSLQIRITDAAPTISGFTNPVTYSQGAQPVVLDASATVADSDTTEFEGAVLTARFTDLVDPNDRLGLASTGPVGLNGTQVTYNGTEIGTISGGQGPDPLTITFNSAATLPMIQAVLDRLTFVNSSPSPATASRSIDITLSDGDGGTSTPVTATVNVTGTSAAPLVGNLGATVTFTEGQLPVLLASQGTVTDSDSPNFNTGVLTFTLTANGQAEDVLSIRSQGFGAGQLGVDGSTLYYDGNVIGTFRGGEGTDPLVVTFNNLATAAAVQAVVRNVTFSNTSQNPPSLQRTVQITLTDGHGGVSTPVSKNVAVTPVNSAPVIEGFDTTETYTENGTPIFVDSDVTIEDADSINFGGGRLTLQLTASPTQASDRLTIQNQGTGAGQIGVSGTNVTYGGVVIGTFSGTGGSSPLTISFNAQATSEATEALLRAIQFSVPGENPSSTPRTLKVTLTDGDGGTALSAVKTIEVIAVEDAAVVAGVPSSLNYTRVSPPLLIAPAATVADSDSANFDGGTISIQILENADSGDQLLIRHQGSGLGQIAVSGSRVAYGGTIIGTFTGGAGGAPLTISLNAAATPAAVQALLRDVTFSNTSATPLSSPRLLEITIDNGDGATSVPIYETINFVLARPVVSGWDTAVTFSENGAPVLLDTNAFVTDSDSRNFNGGNLTLQTTVNADPSDQLGIRNQGNAAGQIGVNGSSVLYGGVVIGTFSGGTGSDPLVVSLNAHATPAAVQALVRNLTFASTSETPTADVRTVQLTITDDNGQQSAAVSKSVTLRAVNDAPVISNFSGTTSYTKGNGPTLIAPDATVTDVDSPDLNQGQLILRITANASSTDRLAIRNQGSGAGQVGIIGTNVTFGGTVIGTFSGGTGTTPLTITFNSKATAEAAQAVLQNVNYSNTAVNPTTATRTVQATLSDGDGGTSIPVSRSIVVTPINNSPTVSGFAGTANYSKNGPPVVLDPDATLTDPDSADFAGGTLTAQITGNAESTDQLAIRNQGSSAGLIGVSGSNVTYGGVVIGTFSGGNGSNPLVVTLNSQATPQAVQALLRNLTFASLSTDPSTLTRTIQVSVTDGDGGASTPVTKSVSITLQPPVISGFDTGISYTENAAPILLDADAVVTDADSANFAGGRLTVDYTLNGNASDRLAIRNQGTGAGQIGLSGSNVTYGGAVIGTWTGGTGTTPLVITFNGNATPFAVQALVRNLTYANVSDTPTTSPRTVRLVLVDDDNLSSTAVTKTINVMTTNDAPVIGSFGSAVAYTTGTSPVLVAPTATVTDSDSNDFNGGQLRLQLTSNAQSLDVLAIRNQGTGAGQIGISGSNVTYGGVVIGTFTGGNGSTALVITLNAQAGAAAVQALLDNITFSTTSTSTLGRTLSVSLTDGDGGTALATKTVNVTSG